MNAPIREMHLRRRSRRIRVRICQIGAHTGNSYAQALANADACAYVEWAVHMGNPNANRARTRRWPRGSRAPCSPRDGPARPAAAHALRTRGGGGGGTPMLHPHREKRVLGGPRHDAQGIGFNERRGARGVRAQVRDGRGRRARDVAAGVLRARDKRERGALEQEAAVRGGRVGEPASTRSTRQRTRQHRYRYRYSHTRECISIAFGCAYDRTRECTSQCVRAAHRRRHRAA